MARILKYSLVVLLVLPINSFKLNVIAFAVLENNAFGNLVLSYCGESIKTNNNLKIKFFTI